MTKYEINQIRDFLIKNKFYKQDYVDYMEYYWKEFGMYIIGIYIDKDKYGYYINIDISYDENDKTVHIEPTVFYDISVRSLQSLINTYKFLINEIYNAME